MSQPPSEFLVVGIGASAGGVEALQAFFAHLPAETGCAFVIILHLSPDHESNLAAILQTVSPLPITPVTERVRVEPDHVYVVPPNQHLTMLDGEVHVSPNLLPEERRAPIDLFFRSLAESHQSRGVCVILSGSGSDGSMGLKRVKERGGAVFVQHPREAAFGEMPRSAIATDLVDEVLPVSAIPARIIAYRASLGAVSIPEEPERRPQKQQQALREIFALLRAHTGHDFANYKRATLLRRIERRISVHTLPNLETYAVYLREHPDEVQALLKDLLISVTNFFRDRQAFAALEQEVLPRLFAGKGAGDQIRVWVVGCATGEEAYSIAMLCAERTLDVVDAPQVQVFATDIDETAITRARNGLYTLADTADISPERLRRFFSLEDERYQVRPELRELILFAQHNILADPPFSHLDLISCRNVLIYLNRTAQERVIETFHFALNPEGYLFLGSVESADSASDLFTSISREHRLFQRRPSAPSKLPIPVSGPALSSAALQHPAPPARLAETETQAHERVSYGRLHLQLLEQYAPPSLLVDQEFTIVHLSERVGRYLQLAAGEPTLNLQELIRPELRMELRGALYQALQRQSNVDSATLPIQVEGRSELVKIRVRPVLLPDDPRHALLLVVFEQDAAATSDVAPVLHTDEPETRQLAEEVARLKRQLRASSEQYEYQAEELKSTNEELQALVEELRASSEELETSKEELQSINEELRTVNQELKVKVEEASQTSADLQNLVNSTDIATIFLDRQLRIKRYTPAARSLFNLIPADYGRPLADLTHQLREVDVLAITERVLASLTGVEREVRTSDDQVYVLRVLPYRVGEDRIGGVVLTCFDITARKRAEEALRASEKRQSFLLKLSDALRGLSDPIEVQATASRVLGEQLQSDRAYYVEIDEARGEYVVARDWHRPGAPSHARRYPLKGWPMPWLVNGRTWVVRDVATDPAVPDEQREAYSGNDIGAAIVVPLIKAGRLVATFATNQRAPRAWTADEVTLVEETAERTWAALERARVEQALRESEARFRRVLTNNMVPMFIWTPEGDTTDANDAFLNLIGYTREELEAGTCRWDVLTPPELQARDLQAVAEVVAQGFCEPYEKLFRHKDGHLVPFLVGAGVFDYSTFSGVCYAIDLTERKRAEADLRASEEKYRTLFETIDEGFCIIERVAVEPLDFRYSEANPAFAAQSGVPDVVGKTIRQVVPGEPEEWFEVYNQVLETREPMRFERELVTTGRVLELYAFPVAGSSDNRLAVIFKDITERKRHEERQAFLLKLSDALRAEPDADAVANRAIAMLSEQLGLDRCYIGVYRLAEDRGDFTHQVGNHQVPPLPDGVRLSDFPEALRTAFDRTLVIDDIAETAGLTDTDRRNLGALGLRALVAVTLRKGDHTPLWSIVAVAARPRRWTRNEIALAEEVTERTWAAMERARVEEALRESEGRLRALVEHLPGGAAFIVDRELRYRLAEGEALHAAGLEPQEYIGKTIYEALPPELAASYEPMFRQALAGNTFMHEHAAHGRSYISRGTPLHTASGEVYAVLTVSYDISDRKRAEEAVRDSEARFRTLADTVPQLIWTNDAAGGAIYFNQRWYAYSGLSKEQSAGLGWQMIVHPDDEAGSVERWQHALAAGEVFETEYRLRRADGVYRWQLGRTVPLRDGHGQIIGWFGSATDIEALKQAEAARQESAVLRRLAEAQEEERLRIARDLHDQLGQQITGLLLGLKQLEGQVADSPAAATLAPLQALALELAKESHRIAVNLRPTALEDVGLVPALERLVADWSRTAGIPAAFASSGLQHGRLPRPVEVALFRVVQEALTNVQKHAAATQVSAIIERRDDQVIAVVEDNGRGFPVDAPPADEGLPQLGLLGMRERVAPLGGTLEIESSSESGTTLFVRIPL